MHQPVDQQTLSRESFHTAAATVTYDHFVNYVIASREMADVQTEGILYRKPALLEPFHSESSLQHSPQ